MKQYLFNVAAFAFILFAATGTQAQQVITTYAGIQGNVGYTGDGGPASAATFNNPSDIIIDPSGNLYIADFVNNVVRKINTTTGIITTVAGNGSGAGTIGGGGYSGDGGPATDASLNGPFALALDNTGNLYVADGYNSVVRKVSPAGIITAFAGNHTASYSGDGGPATAANLNNPVGLAVDKSGNVFIADNHNNVIRKVDVATGIISTVAGSVAAGSSGDGGPATSAKLSLPLAVAFDTAGNMFIADAHNNAIRKVDKAGMISTYAGGTFLSGYTGDGGAATAATLDTPQRISFDDSNNLYIADVYNNVIRKVNNLTGIITTYAGDGTGAGTTPPAGAYGGDDSIPTKAQLYFPHGIAFDHSGKAYIADRGNNVVRKIGPPSLIDHSRASSLNGTATQFIVYPNPAKAGAFTIALASANAEEVAVSISDVLGQTIKQLTIPANKAASLKLDAPAGMYYISATTATAKWSKQLVVE